MDTVISIILGIIIGIIIGLGVTVIYIIKSTKNGPVMLLDNVKTYWTLEKHERSPLELAKFIENDI